MPDNGLTYIGIWAFHGTNLAKLVLPKGLATVYPASFDADEITSITLASGNKNFVVKNNILYNKDMSGLALYPLKSTTENITLAAGLTKLSMTVFGYTNNNIVTLTLPKSLKSITSYYGYGNIPASGFVKLTTIKVASGSKYFKAQNGILYNKSMTKLYGYRSANRRLL